MAPSLKLISLVTLLAGTALVGCRNLKERAPVSSCSCAYKQTENSDTSESLSDSRSDELWSGFKRPHYTAHSGCAHKRKSASSTEPTTVTTVVFENEIRTMTNVPPTNAMANVTMSDMPANTATTDEPINWHENETVIDVRTTTAVENVATGDVLTNEVANDVRTITETTATTTEITNIENGDIVNGTTARPAVRTYNFTTKCTDSDCFTVVSAPNMTDVVLRLRRPCFGPKCKKNPMAQGNKEDGVHSTYTNTKDTGGNQGSAVESQTVGNKNSGYGGGPKVGGYSSIYRPVESDVFRQEATSTSTKRPVERNGLPMHIPVPPDCGNYNSTGNKIVGGESAGSDKWPWMVAYGFKYADSDRILYLCGGALVTAKCSITAAHCLDQEQNRATVAAARFGDFNLDSDNDGAHPITVDVDRVIVHPQFDKRAYVNDIGIVVIKEPLIFTSSINPICLPFGETVRKEKFKGMFPSIAGWGRQGFAEEASGILHDAQVPVVANEDCREIYAKKNRVITSAHICAGGNGKDACQGDSGGPLMVPYQGNYYVIGTVSFGFRCGVIGYPGVYSRVTSYLDWLQHNLT